MRASLSTVLCHYQVETLLEAEFLKKNGIRWWGLFRTFRWFREALVLKAPGVMDSVAVLAEISLRSPRKISIFITKLKNIGIQTKKYRYPNKKIYDQSIQKINNLILKKTSLVMDRLWRSQIPGSNQRKPQFWYAASPPSIHMSWRVIERFSILNESAMYIIPITGLTVQWSVDVYGLSCAHTQNIFEFNQVCSHSFNVFPHIPRLKQHVRCNCLGHMPRDCHAQ